MKVLVLGSGGREHAIAWKLSKSCKVTELFCAPGNAGTAIFAKNVALDILNKEVLLKWSIDNSIDLVVVGPEAPLAVGVVDVFQKAKLPIFGPVQFAAALESSKSFAKEVMMKAGVRTPCGKVFSDYDEACAYVEEKGAPIVIKADGLAAGKGVVVASTKKEALGALHEMMVEKSLGSSGLAVVIEDYIAGREASVIAMIQGDTILPLVVSQDHKRVFDNDKGPNTGGMGAISPTPVLSDVDAVACVDSIFRPVLKELKSRGYSYTGFLYAGTMVDVDGNINVIEFNCRLGDPEAQVIIMRLESDLFDALYAAACGELHKIELKWNNNAAVCVVASSSGYPGAVDDNKVIKGLEIESATNDGVIVFHAGTVLDGSGVIRSKGGRILCVTARGEDIRSARNKVYNKLSSISFDGMHFRTDIGS